MNLSDERRLTRLEAWSESHEVQCRDYLVEIRGDIKEMRSDMKAATKFQNRTILGILLALIAFGAKEVWASRGGIAAGASMGTVAYEARNQ